MCCDPTLHSGFRVSTIYTQLSRSAARYELEFLDQSVLDVEIGGILLGDNKFGPKWPSGLIEVRALRKITVGGLGTMVKLTAFEWLQRGYADASDYFGRSHGESL